MQLELANNYLKSVKYVTIKDGLVVINHQGLSEYLATGGQTAVFSGPATEAQKRVVAAALSGDAIQNKLTSFENQGTIASPTDSSSEFNLEEMHHGLRYANIAGFERAELSMRRYGIVGSVDAEFRGFLQQAESFHGVSGPVLSQNFLISGPSREDCGVFAQATANEIGWPVITMIVDVNENGDGTIKVMAPFRRSLFGPPRMTDLPSPCTLVIQNIDILQHLFWGEEQALRKGQGPYGLRNTDDHSRHSNPGRQSGMHQSGMSAWQHRSLQGEIMGYLGALFARGSLFVIATSAESTAEHPFILNEQFEGLLGKLAEIAIEEPTEQERLQVLTFFSEDHPSFHDLDLHRLSCLSEGMGRYEIVLSCRQAVEFAYSESLKLQRHQMVEIEDVLTQFMRYLPQNSPRYRQVEDYLVARFAENLETELQQAELNSIQVERDTGAASGDEKGETHE